MREMSEAEKGAVLCMTGDKTELSKKLASECSTECIYGRWEKALANLEANAALVREIIADNAEAEAARLARLELLIEQGGVSHDARELQTTLKELERLDG